MSTPEAAWPEPFVEVVARVIGPDESGELVIDSLCGAMELTRMVLEAAVAYRDTETGRAEVVKAEPLGEYLRWLEGERGRLVLAEAERNANRSLVVKLEAEAASLRAERDALKKELGHV